MFRINESRLEVLVSNVLHSIDFLLGNVGTLEMYDVIALEISRGELLNFRNCSLRSVEFEEFYS